MSEAQIEAWRSHALALRLGKHTWASGDEDRYVVLERTEIDEAVALMRQPAAPPREDALLLELREWVAAKDWGLWQPRAELLAKIDSLLAKPAPEPVLCGNDLSPDGRHPCIRPEGHIGYCDANSATAAAAEPEPPAPKVSYHCSAPPGQCVSTVSITDKGSKSSCYRCGWEFNVPAKPAAAAQAAGDERKIPDLGQFIIAAETPWHHGAIEPNWRDRVIAELCRAELARRVPTSAQPYEPPAPQE